MAADRLKKEIHDIREQTTTFLISRYSPPLNSLLFCILNVAYTKTKNSESTLGRTDQRLLVSEIMHNYQDLITKLNNSDEETFWLGPATAEQIKKLENILGIKLPEDFVNFLNVCGGGGAADSDICGIESNNATLDNGGTVNYSTMHCRSEFDLPSHFAVIYLKGDELCWAIYCGPTGNGQVVSYDLFKRKPSKTIAENFYSFFEEYVELRT